MEFDRISVPEEGSVIASKDGKLIVPDNPLIVLIEGDGIGRTINGVPGITDAAVRTLDAAVHRAYKGKRKLVWLNAYAGDAARELYFPKLSDEELKKKSPEEQREAYIPQDTLKAVEFAKVALKGPLTTPIGKGFRSINVFLRQFFDLYACIRPVQYFPGVPGPNMNARDVDMVVFRENTEDVYAGVEAEAGSDFAKELMALAERYGHHIRPGSAVGLKPMSEEGSKRLIRMAIQYAIDNHRKTVTLVHKGNIMKYTEGAFMNWGYELARQEFPDKLVTEKEVNEKYDGKTPEGKVVLNDQVADSMFQQIQLRPKLYSVLVTPNLNGDYISDALAAVVGGLGIAPGANIGDKCAIFEATHGTAPKYTGLDKANPGSMMLSGAMMLDHLGWNEAADLVRRAMQETFSESFTTAADGPGQKLFVTYDIARQIGEAAKLPYGEKDGAKSSAFANRVIHHINCFSPAAR